MNIYEDENVFNKYNLHLKWGSKDTPKSYNNQSLPVPTNYLKKKYIGKNEKHIMGNPHDLIEFDMTHRPYHGRNSYHIRRENFDHPLRNFPQLESKITPKIPRGDANLGHLNKNIYKEDNLFGDPFGHDSDPVYYPQTTGNNYLMYEYTADGKKRNYQFTNLGKKPNAHSSHKINFREYEDGYQYINKDAVNYQNYNHSSRKKENFWDPQYDTYYIRQEKRFDELNNAKERMRNNDKLKSTESLDQEIKIDTHPKMQIDHEYTLPLLITADLHDERIKSKNKK